MVCHPKCTVGNHRRLEEIEEAMIAFEDNASIARRFGLNREAVRNHKVLHLPKKLRAQSDAAAQASPGGERSLWTKLTEREETLERICRRAEKLKQFSTVISASKELREIAELKGKIRGELVGAPASGGDTFNTSIIVGDPDVGSRMAQAYLERHGRPSLSAAVDVEKVKGDA